MARITPIIRDVVVVVPREVGRFAHVDRTVGCRIRDSYGNSDADDDDEQGGEDEKNLGGWAQLHGESYLGNVSMVWTSRELRYGASQC